MNDCYYGHLSIYHFATQFIKNRTVLDAGSGMGYGSAYLAQNGAQKVLGLELSRESVKFSRTHFKLPNLTYRDIDLQTMEGIKLPQFDVIFSSNVLEHLPHVTAFLHNAWKLLKPDGTFIVAVPPITSDIERLANLSLADHLNIWTPKQWHYTLRRYFNEIECYTHNLSKPGVNLKLDNKPEETIIDERDFAFKKISIDDFGLNNPSLTAVFIASQPVKSDHIFLTEKESPFVDQSFTRSIDDQKIIIKVRAALTDIVFSTGTTLGPLLAGNRYCQTFIAKNNNLFAVSLLIATYGKCIVSSAKISLLNSDGAQIRELEINTKELFDNTWHNFLFQPVADSKGKRFTFCMETTGRDEAITLWTNCSVRGVCRNNGEPVQGAICFRSYYQELPCNITAPIYK
jgi:2-polyprenyl-3-methyl-5-hydroxy-6-metoxy-1,4-benzoquinol methylase